MDSARPGGCKAPAAPGAGAVHAAFATWTVLRKPVAAPGSRAPGFGGAGRFQLTRSCHNLWARRSRPQFFAGHRAFRQIGGGRLQSFQTKLCILICTCDRPLFLAKLLAALADQAQDCPIIIVDNGAVPAQGAVAPFQAGLRILYDRFPQPGLVAARNRSIALALDQRPEFLAFIDDDEVPEPGWLAALIGCLERTGADIATGPVLAEFLSPPPAWVIDGEFFIRRPGTATGNLALRRSCLPDDPGDWFNPVFNFLGAEDEEFLKRLMANGARYAAAEDAVVREFVPAARLRRRYIWRLGLRDGLQIAQLDALRHRSRPARAARAVLGCAAKAGYGCNHLFWSLRTPWRLHLGIRDFATVAGILMGTAGLRPRFYGSRHPPAPADAGQTF